MVIVYNHLPAYIVRMRVFQELGWLTAASQIMLWTSLLLGRPQSVDGQTSESCHGVLELRQYTLYPGKREVLISLFEREFIESQEAVGAHVVGQFRDLDNPDRFVWIRGFCDMNSRLKALQAFYDGPVWKAHRDEANATMVDSSNVLLLRPVTAASGFAPSGTPRPPVGASAQAPSLVVATIYYLKDPVDERFVHFFERTVQPAMTELGAPTIAYVQTETAENNFPRLPVRTGENVFVWFSRFANAAEYSAHLQRLEQSRNWMEKVQPELSSYLKAATQRLRLEPTPRSLLR